MKTGLRGVLRSLVAQALLRSGLMWWARRSLMRNKAVVVLMLHRVLPDARVPDTDSESSIVISESNFRSLAKLLASHFEPVDLKTFSWSRYTPKRLPVAVTFDDGWDDNAFCAAPIAADFSVPIAIFVCPGLVGKHSPFWPERVNAVSKATKSNGIDLNRFKTLAPEAREKAVATLLAGHPGLRTPDIDRTMDWPQVLKLRDSGVAFGSHTQNHEIVCNLTPVQVDAELAAAKDTLEDRLGSVPPIFAYPNGGISAYAKERLAQLGYKWAFSTRPGAWVEAGDPLEVPRINISDARVTGYNGQFSRAIAEYSIVWRAFRQNSRERYTRN